MTDAREIGMAAESNEPDDIRPQLSKEEAIAIMRGGLGEAELALAASFCAPIYWVIGRHADGAPIARNGTAFLLDAGEGVFGVTACHVIDGWIRDRKAGTGPLCIATNGNPLVLDWDNRVIAAHAGIDIATFRITPQEVANLGKVVLTGSQKKWPPNPPAAPAKIKMEGARRGQPSVLEDNPFSVPDDAASCNWSGLISSSLEVSNLKSSVFLSPP
jgi:hypothetical protein